MPRYQVNVESLHENFPPGFPVPPLLMEFAEWIRGFASGRFGHFDIQGWRFDDYWIEDGSDLAPFFALFVHIKDGSRIGYWLYNGPDTEDPPIVYVGSEGQTAVLSDTLEDFLLNAGEGRTGIHDIGPDASRLPEGKVLASWARRRFSAPHPATRVRPDFDQWLEEWGNTQRRASDEDPVKAEIAERLRPYLKPAAQPWERAAFDILCVGSQFQVWRRHFGVVPLPATEQAKLEPLFRRVRDERARKFPDRGLWFSSWVTVGTTGSAVLSCDFMKVPKFLDVDPAVPIEEYEKDLRAFPRSTYWFPKWLVKSA